MSWIDDPEYTGGTGHRDCRSCGSKHTYGGQCPKCGTGYPTHDEYAVALQPYLPGWHVYGWRILTWGLTELARIGPYKTEIDAIKAAQADGVGPYPCGDVPLKLVYRPDPHLSRLEDARPMWDMERNA